MPKLPRYYDILPTSMSQHYTNMSERSTKYNPKGQADLAHPRPNLDVVKDHRRCCVYH
jgi:hypothetical protein